VFFLKKPIVIIFSTVCSFFLFGCKSNPPITAKITEISFNAMTFYNGNDYDIAVKTTKNLDAEFTIKSPEKLRNLKLTFSGDFVIYDFYDLSYKIPISNVPKESPFAVIYNSLKEAENGIFYENEKYFCKYTQGDEKYTMFFSGTGLPLEIKSKSKEKFAIFNSVTVLN